MPRRKEPYEEPAQVWRMLLDRARWWGRWTDAAKSIAEYLADRPTDEVNLAELIQQWKLIRQGDKWGHLHTPLKADEMTKEFTQWATQFDEASRAIANYVAIRPVTDPALSELVNKYLEISNENEPTRDKLAKLRGELHAD